MKSDGKPEAYRYVLRRSRILIRPRCATNHMGLGPGLKH